MKTCTEKHPCDKKANGGCEQTCNKDGDNAVCSCAEDYKLKEDGSCEKGASLRYSAKFKP